MPKSMEKRLASDARAGTFARRKARTDQRAYLRKNWLWIFGFYAGGVVLTGWPALTFSNDLARGMGLGASLAGVAGVLAALVIIQTGTGPTLAGELAEQWTAQELRSLTKHGYRLANHVVIDGRGDVDHILIGPGGVFVLETKWSATPWRFEDRFFAAPLDSVTRRARSTWLQLKPHGVPAAAPILVLWGEAARGLKPGSGRRSADGVLVISGHDLQRWLLGRPPGVLSDAQIAAAHHIVCDIAERADKHEAQVPPSVQSLFWRALAVMGAAVLAFSLPLILARFGLAVCIASAVAVLTTGLACFRSGRRLAGIALLAGAAAALAVVATAYVLAWA